MSENMEAEVWKDIPNFEGYQVSNLGRVRTHNKISSSKLYKERHWKDRILKFKSIKPNAYKTGYRVDLWRDGKPHTMLVARLVAFTFYNEDINNHNLTVDHIDGNRFNNNLKNLELVSLAENIRRAFETGLQTRQVKIRIFDKKTKKIKEFMNMKKASLFIGHNHGYIYSKLKKEIFENKEYKWEVI